MNLNKWCESNNIPAKTRTLIESIINSDPYRLVQSRKGNVRGDYPSLKMGSMIQYESVTGERPIIAQNEHDPDVLMFIEQTPPIPLHFKKNGRNIGYNQCVDFFVIRSTSAGWEEFKKKSKLEEIAATGSEQYVCENGKWRCPSGEEHASKFGLYYAVRTEDDIDWIRYRNLNFLSAYKRDDGSSYDDELLRDIESICSEKKGITLRELENLFAPDPIYYLVVKGRLFINLSAVELIRKDDVRVFHNEDAALAYSFAKTENFDGSPLKSISLRIGGKIQFKDQIWTIIDKNNERILMHTDSGEVFPLLISAVETLANQGEIESLEDAAEKDWITRAGKDIMSRANKDDLREANRRYKIVTDVLNHTKSILEVGIPEGTIKTWIASYREGKVLYNNGYIGLIPKTKNRGNCTMRIAPRDNEFLIDFIEKKMEIPKQPIRVNMYKVYKEECEEQGYCAVSSKTFYLRVNDRDKYQSTLKTKGHRAAYKYQPRYETEEYKMPIYGDRPWEIAHADHTQIDVEVIDGETGDNLGKPWCSAMIDSNSRRILAICLTFDEPSYRSCMMLVRVCVQKWNRVPEVLMVDNGSDFRSVYFKSLLAQLNTELRFRPPHMPRFGSIGERINRTFNTQLIHNLEGNTKIMCDEVRQVTKSVNPQNLAIWTLKDLTEFAKRWAYETYDNTEHSTLCMTPGKAYELGMVKFGKREFLMIPYDRDFILQTMPTTKKGTAKVVPRVGVKIHHIYYWTSVFNSVRVEGSQVPVRYDPYNIGVAFAYVEGQWHECKSQYYAELRGITEKQLQIVTNQIKQRKVASQKRSSISASQIVELLRDVENNEELLRQRRKDMENRETVNGLSIEDQYIENEGPDVAESSDENHTDQEDIKPAGEWK